ncbi:iron-sulfur cluster-binding protein [Magnetococcus marinus MC-1]|uniref:Iron-sulfur cluster-binding protein n=1 Tax=Magnetococcus marinus (strain ATCC BAA-1437 / JCM 17883 / MC-1) TaxID=156889 RepID=A0L3V2_MAGMM|nr:4Fe-4S binding protein [Magnetococcus marinus]ABK42645.1 iron-sulfur cluster-binding protein [Magnetococcus marinus MC-1]
MNHASQPSYHPQPTRLHRIQFNRRLTRTAFFTLFLVAPTLDLFRIDLANGHLVLFWHRFTPGVGSFLHEAATSPLAAAMGIALYLLLPVATVIVTVLWISRRWGRLYCGWLCPHFTVVEWINGLMEKALGKPTLWEPTPMGRRTSRAWLLIMLLSGAAMGLLWAVSLITYVLPPQMIFEHIWHGTLTFAQGLFIAVASVVFFIDFIFARHLFCRFGCAVGLAQSLAWMSNPAALSPFLNSRERGSCSGCPAPCVTGCPMRLDPRGGKRRISTCTQCGICVQGCADISQVRAKNAPLIWTHGAAVSARPTSLFIHKGTEE